jgi:hypothetical protein
VVVQVSSGRRLERHTHNAANQQLPVAVTILVVLELLLTALRTDLDHAP